MKKMFIIIVLAAFVVSMSSCAFFRKSALKISEEDLKNAEVSRVIAKNCLSTWPLNSAFIKAAMGSSFDKLPYDAIKAMKDLDLIAAKEEEYTDYDLGWTLGAKLRLLTTSVKEALKQIAPNVLKLLPYALP